jgi:hypothetical protein
MEVADLIRFLLEIDTIEVVKHEVYGLEFDHNFSDFVSPAVGRVGLSDRRVERLGVKMISLGSRFGVQVSTAVVVGKSLRHEVA